jgi:hypothetical protein
MLRRLTRLTILVAVLAAISGGNRLSRGQEDGVTDGRAATGVGGACGPYACRPWEYGNPALFYNFYVPNNCGGVPATLYVAPYPVPQFVGHTYYTYQPLMPHEFMYPHYRKYRNYYDEGRGIDRTKVQWYSNPVATVLKDVYHVVKLPR